MEPPLKKLRRSPRYEPANKIDPSPVRSSADPQNQQADEQRLIPPTLAPTRTLDLSGFQRRYVDQYGAHPNRNPNGRLSPRNPDVTVTANVVDIAILDEQDRTSFTQISAPTTKSELPVPSVGMITIPAVVQVASIVDSNLSGLTPIVTSAGSLIVSAIDGLTSSSTSANGTSSTPKTITVTSTSTLSVSVRNGTVASSVSSHASTRSSRERSTLTRESSSGTHEPTGYQFGDFVTASMTSVPTNAYNTGYGSTATVSSANEATSTSASTGGAVVLTPQQQQMVGGVVGGVAGVALVLLAILYFLKWYRKHLQKQGRLPEQTLRHRQLPSGDDHAFIHPAAMTQPSGPSLMPIATLKQSIQRLRPQSAYTLASSTTDHSTFPQPDSERSFQRVSGRKIPSVLLTGGNEYGDEGPVSPISDHSGFPRSREVSQTSTYSQPQSLHAPVLGLPSGRSTPVRAPVSPFLDPPDGQDHDAFPLPVPRGFNSRSPLSIQTAGLSALNPNRHSEGSVTIRPSPARTPTTTSPTSSSLRLPMNTPPLMPGDIPEMPTLHPSRLQMPPRTFSDDALSAHRSIGQRSYSAISVRSSNSFGGRFKEEI